MVEPRVKPFRLKRSPSPRESQIQATILRCLCRHPRVGWVLRINGGGTLAGRRMVWFYRLMIPGAEFLGKGASDLLVGLKGGGILAIECKRPGERVTEEQDRFLFAVEKAGGQALVARSWAEVRAKLEEVDSA